MTLQDDTVRQLRDLLRRAQQEPYTITLLTDEELIAVEQNAAATPHPTPWTPQAAGVSHEIAREFGVRSLLARGMLRQTTPAPGVEPVLDVPPEVRTVLDTRRVGLGYMRAMQPDGDSAASKIVVVQPEFGAFEEDISLRGFHLFSACNYDDATSRISDWCVPTGGRPSGGTTEIAAAEWPMFLHSELPDAKASNLSIEVYLPDGSGRREPVEWLIAYSETVALLAVPRPGDRLAIRPVTRERLRDLLDDRIAAALQYTRNGGPNRG